MQKLINRMGCIGLILIISACGSTEPEPDITQSLGWDIAGPVIDGGDILTKAEEKILVKELKGFAKKQGVRLMLYTVPDLQGETIEGLSLSLKDRLQVGKPDLNNGGVIYISKADRQVKVEAEPGLEWQIPDSVALQIVDLMVPDFRENRFLNGLQKGFGRMAELGGQVSWKPKFQAWSEVVSSGEAAVGEIVRLEGTGPHREVGTGYTKNQFDPELYGKLGLVGSDSVEVRFTRYMLDMFDNHFGTDRPMILTGRVAQLEPPVVRMIAVE
ncbi:MAG: TPM domain-containing protein [Bacteroidota bacterium]